MITSVTEMLELGYDNFCHRNARVTKLWSHDQINIII